jgi:hypothetical protein
MPKSLRITITSALLAISVVGLLGISLALVLPENGEFVTEPEERFIPKLTVPKPNCQIAKYHFEELFSNRFRGCENDNQCELELHPIGCMTAISKGEREEFQSKRKYIKAARDVAGSKCSLPVAKCGSYGRSPICKEGRCALSRDRAPRVNLFPKPEVGEGI